MTTDITGGMETTEIPNEIPVIGIVALEQGVISKEQLSSAIKSYEKERLSGNDIRFEDVLIEQNYISEGALEALIVKSIRRMNKEFCNIIVEQEFVSRQHADNALSLQAKKYKSGELILVSDFLIKAGLLSEEQRDLAYGIQSERVAEIFKQYTEKKSGNSKAEKKENGYADTIGGYKVPATAKIAIKNKLINKEKLEETLRYCDEENKAGRKISFEDALVEKEYVAANVMEKLIAETIRKMKMTVGEIAVEEGYISQAHMDKALKIQGDKSKEGESLLIGDLLVKAGLLTEKKRDEILEAQNMKTLDWMRIDFDAAKEEKFKESKRYQKDIMMGELAVTYSFITRKEFEIGLKYLEKAYQQDLQIPLERILLEKGFLDEEKATLLHETKKFLDTRDLDTQFVLLAVKEDYISREISMAMLAKQLEEFDQRKLCLTMSEIVLDEKLMTVEQCNVILAKQKRGLIVREEGEKDDLPGAENEAEAGPVDKEKDSGILSEIEMGSEIFLNIGEDLLQATIIIPVGYPESVLLQDIKKLMVEKKLSYGIVKEVEIEEQLLQDETEVRQITVAKGKPPTSGKDAELIMNFQREYLNPGKVTGDGHIDFKDRGEVPFAEKGVVLVEITPEEPGKHGLDVFGEVIPALPVKGITATAGQGAKFSEDGLKIIAVEDGNPSMTVTGEVSVRQEIVIAGDVDYNTGNIIFDGHIIVKGMVKEGFSVIGGSLSVKEIDGGYIDLKGNLEVSGGILNADIKLEGNLQAMYMADSVVESYSDVIVKKEIIGSTILTSGACKSEGTIIITSEITAMNGIEASRIGTDVSKKCILRVGVTDHIDKEINIIKEQLEQKTETLRDKQKLITDSEAKQADYHVKISESAQKQEGCETRINKLKEDYSVATEENIKSELLAEITEFETMAIAVEQKITGYFDAQDTLMNEALAVREECEIIMPEIEKYNSAIREIRDWEKKQSKSPVVKTMKDIHEGTVIIGQNTSLVIKGEIKNSSVKEVEGDLLQREPQWVMKVFPN